MKYFLLLLLCAFYTIDGFAEQQLVPGQKIAVRRSSGNFSNAQILAIEGNQLDVLIREPDGRQMVKGVDLNKPNSYISQPLRSPVGHLRKDEVISFPRTAGGRSNGLVTEIRGKQVKVEWIDENGKFEKWVNITDVDRPREVTMPLSPNRQGRTGGVRGGVRVGWLAVLSLAGGIYAVLKDGAVTLQETQDQAMQALDDALMTASVEASERHPDVIAFNKLLNQMHRTADHFIENNMPMSSRQRQSILALLDQARDQFSGDQDPRGISQREKQMIYDQITAFRNKLQQIGRNHPQDTGSTQTPSSGQR